MQNYLKRCDLGMSLMFLSIIGIPFMPAVPVTAAFGAFKGEGTNEGFTSIFLTIIVGIISYILLGVWLLLR